MNLKKVTFLIVAFLLIAMATGCSYNGEYAHKSQTKGKQVVIKPSMTGFWETRSVYANAD